MKRSKIVVSSMLTIFGLLCVVFLIINSYGAQVLKGQWFAGLDPKRWEHVEGELQNKTDGELYKLLFHGDHVIRGAALMQLSSRKKIEWFDKYEKMLKHHRFNIRSAGRGLMFSVGQESNVCEILMKDIKKYKADSEDYLQIILMLVRKRYQPIFPHIVVYAKEKGWRSAAPRYFEELGNPEALAILYELKNQVPDTKNLSIVDELAVERLGKAIAALEAIKTKKQ